MSIFISLIFVDIVETYRKFIIISKYYHCLTSNIDGMGRIARFYRLNLEILPMPSILLKHLKSQKKLKETTSASSMTDECDIFNAVLYNED